MKADLIPAAELSQRMDALDTEIARLQRERELIRAARMATECYEALDTPGNLKGALEHQGRLRELRNTYDDFPPETNDEGK